MHDELSHLHRPLHKYKLIPQSNNTKGSTTGSKSSVLTALTAEGALFSTAIWVYSSTQLRWFSVATVVLQNAVDSSRSSSTVSLDLWEANSRGPPGALDPGVVGWEVQTTGLKRGPFPLNLFSDLCPQISITRLRDAPILIHHAVAHMHLDL